MKTKNWDGLGVDGAKSLWHYGTMALWQYGNKVLTLMLGWCVIHTCICSVLFAILKSSGFRHLYCSCHSYCVKLLKVLCTVVQLHI